MREIAKSHPAARVLVVEDEVHLADPMVDLLRSEGHEVEWSPRLDAARRRVGSWQPELILLDLGLPDGPGLDLLEQLPSPPEGPTVVVLTADGSAATAVDALRRGAHDYLTKPFEAQVLLHRLELAAAHHRAETGRALRARMRRLRGCHGAVPQCLSPVMGEVYAKAARLAAHDLPVLVWGETGVGKEHVSRLLHDLSPRASQPFLAVNCAELDRQLLRSELFGHEKGAFTGADSLHKGLFELAAGGTLMLDEVAEMPADAQASLLRVLESGRFRRVGGSTELRSRVRIVAATNKDLLHLSRENRFREDLYYRLVAIELRVPPLRERLEDVPALASEFANKLAAQLGRDVCFTTGAFARLVDYAWPGNVRELRNAVERSVLIHGGGELSSHHISLGPDSSAASVGSAGPGRGYPGRVGGEEAIAGDRGLLSLREVEERHIRRVLDVLDGNRSRAARVLGIARSTLLRKLEQLG